MGYGNGGGLFTALVVRVLAALTIIFVVFIGIGLGLSLAETTNIRNNENFIEFAPALPTKILDINGTLITEFASEEKRELVPLNELPRDLIHAVLSREDPDFYNHKGFSIRGLTRAVVGQLTGHDRGGGSTITQQVAGTLYTDRRERSYKRKIKELWWAFQMERRYTKNEILEIYLNYMNMGPGTFGVETTSRHFFGKSARDVTLAESAILAVLLSNPSHFNPISKPNEAMDRQRFVLDRMIMFGYTTREEADASFNEYWDNFDYTQASVSAYFSREDKAPWFSEYVRRELEGMMYGARDYYRDGFTVNTTLDLHHQETAEKLMADGIERANRVYSNTSARSNVQAERTYIPVVDLLTLVFDLTDIRNATHGQNERRAESRYIRTLNPVVDLAALSLGILDLKDVTSQGFAQMRLSTEKNMVEGALISIEVATGYITAIVGGSKYDESNQLIRASQANVQYGSSFKPLYYSAAIDSRLFTAGTLIYDIPVVFHNEDGTPYIPYNFRGEWKGSVLLYEALAHSMNVPSIKILDGIGFDAAIDRASTLLDITDPAQVRQKFPRVYPLGLGITSSAPIKIARAFSVFSNQGRVVTPISIRTVEDRNGRVVIDVERDLRQRQRRMGENMQVISPQNAYIMTKILEKTVEFGTLANASGWGAKFTFKDEDGKSYKMPVAGKTGTPQNWSDAWAVGYTPYYTTAVWFGFDKPGNSLGVDLTGATLSGPIWADFMREIHRGLPRRDFPRPSSGIIDVTVCYKSGMLRTANCNQGEVTLPYLEGTQPSQYCDLHSAKSPYTPTISSSSPAPVATGIEADLLKTLSTPEIKLDLLPPDLRDMFAPAPPQQRNAQQPAATTTTTAPATTNSRNQPRTNTRHNQQTQQQQGRNNQPPALNNPFLDDEPPPFVPGDNFGSDDELPSWNPLDG
jgi:penicillin-binding protein 1A